MSWCDRKTTMTWRIRQARTTSGAPCDFGRPSATMFGMAAQGSLSFHEFMVCMALQRDVFCAMSMVFRSDRSDKSGQTAASTGFTGFQALQNFQRLRNFPVRPLQRCVLSSVAPWSRNPAARILRQSCLLHDALVFLVSTALQ